MYVNHFAPNYMFVHKDFFSFKKYLPLLFVE